MAGGFLTDKWSGSTPEKGYCPEKTSRKIWENFGRKLWDFKNPKDPPPKKTKT